jgi:hypothetical protein
VTFQVLLQPCGACVAVAHCCDGACFCVTVTFVKIFNIFVLIVKGLLS